MNIHRVYEPFLSHFRRARVANLFRWLELGPSTRVLDIGGAREFWACASSLGLPQPRVTVINLRLDQVPRSSIQWVIGDARSLPFSDMAFDVAISNSVIEHLGDWDSQRCFASEVQRIARRYFVQTPNLWFPVEPHFITPFVHWVPQRRRGRLLRNFTVWGLIARPTLRECEAKVEEIRLLSKKEMRRLFPLGELVEERFLGLSKSLVAVHNARIL